MRKMYKWELPFVRTEIMGYDNMLPRKVGVQINQFDRVNPAGRRVTIWCECEIESQKRWYCVHKIATGEEIPQNTLYVDTVIDNELGLVFHYFIEKKSLAAT